MEGWQEYQLENEALDENCLLLNMEADKLNIPCKYLCQSDLNFNFVQNIEIFSDFTLELDVNIQYNNQKIYFEFL